MFSKLISTIAGELLFLFWVPFFFGEEFNASISIAYLASLLVTHDRNKRGNAQVTVYSFNSTQGREKYGILHGEDLAFA